MKKIEYLILVLISLLAISCNKEDNNNEKGIDLIKLYELNEGKITISQGLAGTLIITEGNCMPMFDTYNWINTFKAYPVKRKILIYEYTLLNNVIGYGPFYDSVETHIIGETESDENGFYQIKVDSGRYSIFILENEKYYASSGDGQGGINPIYINIDSVSIKNLRIDYCVY